MGLKNTKHVVSSFLMWSLTVSTKFIRKRRLEVIADERIFEFIKNKILKEVNFTVKETTNISLKNLAKINNKK